MPATLKSETEANGCGVNDIGVKCGFTASTSETKNTVTNKNIDTADKIKNFTCFMTVILAVIKTKAVCFNFYFNKELFWCKENITQGGRKITEISAKYYYA